jgi:IMP dehydrogenase
MAAITFSDVLIIPKHSDIRSRKDVKTLQDFQHFKMGIPVFSANMKTITGYKMAIAMSEFGGMGVLHRFCSVVQAQDDFSYCLRELNTEYNPSRHYGAFVSVGVQESDRVRFDQLYEVGARLFCIDVAHGDHIMVKEMIEWIHSRGLNDIEIMAGNVATGDGAYNLAEWGADIIKVGIGPGHACTTRKNTGVGVPQLQAIKDVREELTRQGKKVKIISDGGIESVGDICKALKYADAVMLGRFLSGTTETDGPVFQNPRGEFYKVYAGSASGENKNTNGQTTDFVEGIAMEVPFRGHVKYLLRAIKEGIQSACSYVGANNLDEFREKCEFMEISGSSKQESKI